MEHPILFISLVLQALGLPVPHTVVGHTFIEQLCTPYMTYTWFVMAFLVMVSCMTLGKMELVPGSGQNFWEVIIGGLMGMLEENLGEKGAKMLFPMMATFFLYILTSNIIGLIPGFTSPTANLNITLAMTIVVWLTHHYLGFKYHGLHYYRHFMGPNKWLAPLMFVLEVVGNLARLVSLSMRLFGNIFAKEVLLSVLFMLAGAFFAPLPILMLGVLVSVIQAVVFVLLSTIYCAGSMAPAH